MANDEAHIRLAQDFENLNVEERGNAEEQRKLRELEDLMLHASQCRSPTCQHPGCRRVKWIFCHAVLCKTHASGGCQICLNMWSLVKVHAQACKEESNCNVPRCGDMKERLQQQSDSLQGVAEIGLAQDFENVNIEDLGYAEEQSKISEFMCCQEESNCKAPCCREMKERLQQQSDSVRGAAEVGRAS